jgi:pantetheine-phosphate adenylyltransferase
MSAPDNRVAICPGTYDPITNGHLDVIGRASVMYDHVIVAVVNNPWRKTTTLFTAEERVALAQGATGEFGNVTAEPFSTLVVEFARDRGAMAIVKGLRAISDFEYELEMNQLNRRQAPDIESVYLMASAKYSFVRSSGVKELATFGGNIDDMVPEEVATAMKERLGR